jgi:RHS repeat-associated protein
MNITDYTQSNLSENYHYDNLDRLDQWWLNNNSTHQTTDYYNNGNIKDKIDIGNYVYSNTKLNAAVKVDNPSGLISSNTQTIEYTYFNKTQTVKELDITVTPPTTLNQLDYTYGADKERIKADTRDATGNIVSTKYYLGEYEKEVLPVTNGVHEVSYIGSPDGLCAMFVNDNGTEKLYYVYSDHLGSLNTLTDDQGNITAQQNFDPWGRARNPNTWDFTAGAPALPAWLTRGYTGHEHLPQFNLINMNGRMYDPLIARMLSADNVVTDPANTQSHNRYSYVDNNPLKNTDPSGYTGVGIGTGGIVSLSSGSGDFSAFSPGHHDQAMDAEIRQANNDRNENNLIDMHNYLASAREVKTSYKEGSWNTRYFDDGSGFHIVTETHIEHDLARPKFFSLAEGSSGYNGPPEGKQITPSMRKVGQYLSQASKTLNMFTDWALGMGSENRSFVNDNVANSLRSASKVNEARNFYYNKYKGAKNLAGTYVNGFSGKFGAKEFWRAGLNPVQQFIGTDRISIYNYDGKTLWFLITNKTSMNSFLYDQGPSWQRSTWSPGGDMNQMYIFSEPIRK